MSWCFELLLKRLISQYYFTPANQQKKGTQIYSLTQCSLTVNECDWHILAATTRELIHIVLKVKQYNNASIANFVYNWKTRVYYSLYSQVAMDTFQFLLI